MLADELNLFSVRRYLLIDTRRFRLPIYLGKQVCFIIFDRMDLENPATDPIGIFYKGGIKTFLWRKREWAGIDYDINNITSRATYLIANNELNKDSLEFIAEFAMLRSTQFGLNTNTAAIRLL